MGMLEVNSFPNQTLQGVRLLLSKEAVEAALRSLELAAGYKSKPPSRTYSTVVLRRREAQTVCSK